MPGITRGGSSVADHDAAAEVTLIVGPPARFYYIKHTWLHLRHRGFQRIYWLRTPDAPELDPYNMGQEKRCMMFWYTTVLPALRKLELEQGVR